MTRREMIHQMSQYKYAEATGNGSVSFSNGVHCVYPSVKLYGGHSQSGTPTPDTPIAIMPNNAKYHAPLYNQRSPEIDNNLWSSGTSGASLTVVERINSSITVRADAPGDLSFLSAGYRFSVGKQGDKVYYKLKWERSEDATGYLRAGIGGTLKSASICAIVEHGPYATIVFNVLENNTIGATYTISDLVIVNLTQMFGAGNEPTTTEEVEQILSAYGISTTTQQPHLPNGRLLAQGEADLSLLQNGGLYGINTAIDEWDCQSGKGIKRTGQVNIDSSRILINASDEQYTYATFATTDGKEVTDSDTTIRTVSSKFVGVPASGRQQKAFAVCMISSKRIFFSFKNSDVGITSDMPNTQRKTILQQWFSDNATTVYYEIETPQPFTAAPQKLYEPSGAGSIAQFGGDVSNTKIDVKYVRHST